MNTTAAHPSSSSHPSAPVLEDRIRERAYELYLLRGGKSGDALQDWLQAECELRTPGVATETRPRVVPAAKRRVPKAK